mmetsp:Transcript_12245/g.37525  ORF Transcript_12245/g.37525 Transcript_12245/m.37525 type:complete len:155 (-) Transcript_12245:46-510(-)
MLYLTTDTATKFILGSPMVGHEPPIPLEYFACGANGRNGAVSTEGESRYPQHHSQEVARATDPSATVSNPSTLNSEMVADAPSLSCAGIEGNVSLYGEERPGQHANMWASCKMNVLGARRACTPHARTLGRAPRSAFLPRSKKLGKACHLQASS